MTARVTARTRQAREFGISRTANSRIRHFLLSEFANSVFVAQRTRDFGISSSANSRLQHFSLSEYRRPSSQPQSFLTILFRYELGFSKTYLKSRETEEASRLQTSKCCKSGRCVLEARDQKSARAAAPSEELGLARRRAGTAGKTARGVDWCLHEAGCGEEGALVDTLREDGREARIANDSYGRLEQEGRSHGARPWDSQREPRAA